MDSGQDQAGVFVSDHPVIADKLARLRQSSTPSPEFRRLIQEISLLLGLEATKDLKQQRKTIETPLMSTEVSALAEYPFLVPVLRAGLGMVEAMLQLIPECIVGHVGLYRDHQSLKPVLYYSRLPQNLEGYLSIILDPMLATGGTVSHTASLLKARGAKRISLISIVGAPEGIARMQADHPEVRIYLGALDQGLNDKGYILPGLGDAGDRLYQTTTF